VGSEDGSSPLGTASNDSDTGVSRSHSSGLAKVGSDIFRHAGSTSSVAVVSSEVSSAVDAGDAGESDSFATAISTEASSWRARHLGASASTSTASPDSFCRLHTCRQTEPPMLATEDQDSVANPGQLLQFLSEMA